MSNLIQVVLEKNNAKQYYDIPEPSSYEATTSTLVNSSRNSLGKLIGSIIREDVAKISLTWKYLSVEDWAYINKWFNTTTLPLEYYGDITTKGNFIQTIRFFNQSKGIYEEREMYISDRQSGMWRKDSETGDVLGWTNCSISLIEV